MLFSLKDFDLYETLTLLSFPLWSTHALLVTDVLIKIRSISLKKDLSASLQVFFIKELSNISTRSEGNGTHKSKCM